MFVSKGCWILKTCGTTTPLQCLQPILNVAVEVAGFEEIEELFYCRKNYERPESQCFPLQGFEKEVAYLDQYFNDGLAHSLESVNGECLFLYTVCRRGKKTKNRLIGSFMSSSLDQMTTMLTTELDPNVTLPFANEQDTAEVDLEKL